MTDCNIDARDAYLFTSTSSRVPRLQSRVRDISTLTNLSCPRVNVLAVQLPTRSTPIAAKRVGRLRPPDTASEQNCSPAGAYLFGLLSPLAGRRHRGFLPVFQQPVRAPNHRRAMMIALIGEAFEPEVTAMR